MHRTIIVATAVWAALTVAFADGAETLSDDATKEKIASFVTWPSRLCGRATVDFWNEIKSRKLTNCSWFDGDTNRLARLICELAQTNDARTAMTMTRALGEYGTVEQLPFFYSCATNPVLGKIAVESVLRIEGVNSNSLEVVRSYLCQTNQFPVANIGDRTYLCRDLLGRVFADPVLTCYRPLLLGMIDNFQIGLNVTPNGVDMAIISVTPDYRYSKRRLAVLRAVKQRLDNDAQYMAPTNHEAALQIDVYDFQTNYLTTAINELVAYPEANLPD